MTAPLSVGGVAEGDAVSDGDAEALGDGVSLGEGVGEGDGSAVAESKAESDAPADSVGAPVAVGAPRLPVAPPLCDGAMVKVGAPVHEALAVAVVPLRPPMRWHETKAWRAGTWCRCGRCPRANAWRREGSPCH